MAHLHTFANSHGRHLRWVALISMIWAVPAFGISSFFTSIDATLQVTGPSADLLVFQDPLTDVWADNEPVFFPSFINNAATGDWNPVTRTLTANAETNAAANPSGITNPTFASGMTRFVSSIGVYNPTDFGLFLDMDVSAFFEYAGFANDHGREGAETVAAFSFFGDPELAVTPADTSTVIRKFTWDTTPRSDFDLVTSLAFLGEPTTWSILIPPSDTEIGPGVIERRIWTVGLALQVGGTAISRGDGSLIISEIPPGPEVLPAGDIPEPATALLLAGLTPWLMHRHGPRRPDPPAHRPVERFLE